MARNWYGREWGHGVGTGRPGAIYVFKSEAERDDWVDSDPMHRDVAGTNEARLMRGVLYWVRVDAEVPSWVASEPHWRRWEQTAGIDGWDTYEWCE